MSNPAAETLVHSAFYRFVALADPAAVADAVRALAAAHRLQGSILLAAEGISGAVAGAPTAVAAFEAELQALKVLVAVQADVNLPASDPAAERASQAALLGVRFKHSACLTEPFGRLKVSVKPEIVALALPAAENSMSALTATATATASFTRAPSNRRLPLPDEQDDSHLSPPAWRELLARQDLVLLDNRNHFEFRLGHFKGAVDPQVHHFRDFVAYVQAHAPAWREAQRPVAMYCTGGVRCDKTAPWLRSLGLQVWQLDGGILNYFQSLDDAASDWTGDCFVFDNRLALNCALQETGASAEEVFDANRPDEAWRLQRAQRLQASGGCQDR